MKLAVALAVVSAMCCGQEAQAKVSVGAVVSYPEWFGLYASLWPTEDISFDLRGTLSTVDAGLTGHIPLADNGAAGRHDLLVHALGGFVHGGVANTVWTRHGARLVGAVGYGMQAGWDVRVLVGVSAAQAMVGWATGFTGMAYVGHSF